MTHTPTSIEIIRAVDDAMEALQGIYGSPGAAVIWLTSEQPLLDECIPLVLIKNGKAPEVMNLIRMIEKCAYT